MIRACITGMAIRIAMPAIGERGNKKENQIKIKSNRKGERYRVRCEDSPSHVGGEHDTEEPFTSPFPQREPRRSQRPLCDGSDRGDNRSGNAGGILHGDVVDNLAIGGLLGAVARNMASLTALIAGLASSVQGAAVGGSAVT